MPRKYPLEVEDVIYALRSEGVQHDEIRRRLRVGEAGIKWKGTIKEGTYWATVNRLKRKRGEPEDKVEEGQELDKLGALTRLAIAALMRDQRRILKREKQEGNLDEKERKALIANANAVVGLRRQITNDSQQTQAIRARHSQPLNVLTRLRSPAKQEGKEQGGTEDGARTTADAFSQPRSSRTSSSNAQEPHNEA